MAYTTISRQDLYESVWETPITDVANRFGVSDVAVAKACAKRNIPTPPRGHWAKVDAGQIIRNPPLPDDDPGRGAISFNGQRRAQEQADAYAQRVVRQFGLENLELVVPERLSSVHELTDKTRQYLSTVKPNSDGEILCSPPNGYDLRISRAQEGRALRLLDTMVKALEKHGAKITFDEAQRNMRVHVGRGDLRFNLREISVREEVVPPASQKGKPYWGPKYAYKWTGKLQLKMEEYFSIPVRRTWMDRSATLEEQISSVVIGFFVAGQLDHERTLERETEQRRWDEEERRRREIERLRELEKKAVEAFSVEVNLWKTFNLASEYLGAIKVKISSAESKISENGKRWIDATEARIEGMNPLKKRINSLLDNATANDGYVEDDDAN